MELKRRNFICMGIAACICLTSCGVLPTEEEFDAAPVVKEYEGTSFNKVTVVRGNLVQTEDISGTYKGTVREDFGRIIGELFAYKGRNLYHQYPEMSSSGEPRSQRGGKRSMFSVSEV